MGWFARLCSAGIGDLDAAMPANACLIDVRSPAEYGSGAIQGSINLPLDRFAQLIESTVPDRHTPVLVYCAAGGRSAPACAHMQHLGYTQVSNGGGVSAVALRLQRPIVRA